MRSLPRGNRTGAVLLFHPLYRGCGKSWTAPSARQRAADLAATCKGEASVEPTECICKTLCAEGNVNLDCPVCSAEGADLTACKGTDPAEPVCTCTTLCTQDSVNLNCPVCGTEGADFAAICKGVACNCTTPCTEGAMNETCPGLRSRRGRSLCLYRTGSASPQDSHGSHRTNCHCSRHRFDNCE